MMLTMIATCPEETKELLCKELEQLGATEIKSGYRMVQFCTDETGFYQVHLSLRTASRLLLVIRECAAKSGNMLFDQARRIPWQSYLPPQTTFLVEGVQGERGPGHMKSNDISKRVREALEACFTSHNLPVPRVDLKEPKVKVVAHIAKGRATISIDTSGKGLHKRGYHGEGHPAPIKETLAASMLMLMNYDGTLPLLDPMCGSGTIVIEAAYLALNKAPLIHRKKDDFGFEHLALFNRSLWRQVQDQARAAKASKPVAAIYGSDINRGYVAISQTRAERARVAQHLHLDCRDFFSLNKPFEHGLLLTNLPYGERIKASNIDDSDMQVFYQRIGDHLKQNFKGWRAGLLVSQDSPYKFIGLKPKKKINLKNGSIPVKLLVFDLY